jgi:hypothetical protein
MRCPKLPSFGGGGGGFWNLEFGTWNLEFKTLNRGT